MSETELLAAIKDWFENTEMQHESLWVDFDEPACVRLDGHFNIVDLAKKLAEKLAVTA
jgi:hypothetical protein